MGLEDKFGKVPLRRIFRPFFEALFDPENGHDHDGVNSKTLSSASVVENGSVTTVKIVDEAVTADKIAANAVTTAKLANGAVTGAKIPAQNITTTHLADENVTAPKIADGAVTADKIGAGAVVEEKLGDGAVTAAKIGASAVEEAKINDGAVTAGKIGAGAVVEEKLGDGAVTAAKIGASAVEEAKINDGAVTAGKIGAGAVTAAALNADVAGNGVGLNTGTNAIEVKVDDATIEISSDALQLKAGGVDTAHLADDAVTSDKIADGAVTADKLADTASLASLIGAGLGAVKTVAHNTEGSPITLLTADDAARACLVVALVGETLDDGAGFSIEDEDETALLDVTTGTTGGVLVGAGTLAANKALQIAITAGGAAAAGEVTVFVIAIPEA